MEFQLLFSQLRPQAHFLFPRAGAYSVWESHKLIALQTAKHDGFYPLLSVSLTVPPFVESFQQRDDPCRVGFYAFAFTPIFLIP